MAIADWTVPFLLTSLPYTDFPTPGAAAPNPLPINTTTTLTGGQPVIYRLRPDGCSMTNVVRETKDYVPQADGAILHHRFIGGMEAQLTFQMWLNDSKIACDAPLQEMVDTLEAYLYGLINAGDNEGRLTWKPVGGASGAPGSNGYRMMEDIRLLSYPVESQAPGAPFEIEVTIDCERPYCEDETQLSPAVPGTAVNYGNKPTYPVYKIYGSFTSFTLTNSTTGEKFSFDGALPGAGGTVGVGDYLEIDTFRNTVYLNGAGANRKPGVVMVSSDFSPLVPGNNILTCPGVGAASLVLVNAAWA